VAVSVTVEFESLVLVPLGFVVPPVFAFTVKLNGVGQFPSSAVTVIGTCFLYVVPLATMLASNVSVPTLANVALLPEIFTLFNFLLQLTLFAIDTVKLFFTSFCLLKFVGLIAQRKAGDFPTVLAGWELKAVSVG